MRGFLGLLLGGVLLWVALRGLDLRVVVAQFTDLRVVWALLAIAFYAADLAVRVVRWRSLLDDRRLSYREVASALLVGYGANFLLPARLGELVRMELMRRAHKVPRAVAIASIVMERVLDGVCVVLLLATGLWLAGATSEHDGVLIACAASGAAIFGLALCGWLTLRAGVGIQYFAGRWPALGGKLAQLAASFAAVRGRFLAWVTFLTCAAYVLEAMTFSAICRAFDIAPSLPELMVLLSAAALSTLLPSAPGFVGSFQIAFVLTFAFFGQAAPTAVAAATLMQLLLFAPLGLSAVPFIVRRRLFRSAEIGRGVAAEEDEAGMLSGIEDKHSA